MKSLAGQTYTVEIVSGSGYNKKEIATIIAKSIYQQLRNSNGLAS